jgi:hypothetical protein
MTAQLNENTQYIDSVTGELLVNGLVYIGENNLDAELNPIIIYADADLTTPISNPQRIGLDGRVENKIFIPDKYSLKVKSANNVQKLNDLSVGEEVQELSYDNKAEAAAVVLTPEDAGRVIFVASSDGGWFSVEYDVTAPYTDNGGAYCGTVFIPSGGDGTIGIERDDWRYIDPRWFGVDITGVAAADTELRAALNVGPVIAAEGSYLLSAFEFSSGDYLVGVGKDALFKSASGVIFAFGAIDAGAFTSGNVIYSAATNPSVGDTSITMTTVADANKYSVGEIVALWSQEGYADGFATFKPLYQQLVSVRSVNGTTGVVELDDTIYKTYSGTQFRVTKGSEITNSEGTANGFTRDITVGNFAVSTPNDSWTRWGGTYNTHIFNIDLVETKGAFVNNGFAKSRLENVGGLVSQRGMDLAYFSHDSHLSFGSLSCFNEAGVIGAYKFAEGAHDNTVINQSVDLPEHTATASALLIGFDVGSTNNKLTGGVIRAGNYNEIIKINNQDGGVTVLTHDGNLLDDIDIRVTSSDNFIKSIAVAPTDRTGILIGDGVKIHSDNNTLNAIFMQTSGVKIRGASLSAPVTRAINTTAGVVDGEITKVKFSVAPFFSGIDEGASVIIKDNVYGDDSLNRGLVNFTSAAAITSTSSTNTVITRVFPAGTLLNGDVIKFEAFLQKTGNTDVANIAIRVNGTNYALYSSAAASTSLSVIGSLNLISSSAQRMYLAGQDGANASLSRGASFINTATTDLTVEVALWVDNAADSIVPDSITMSPFRQQ